MPNYLLTINIKAPFKFITGCISSIYQTKVAVGHLLYIGGILFVLFVQKLLHGTRHFGKQIELHFLSRFKKRTELEIIQEHINFLYFKNFRLG